MVTTPGAEKEEGMPWGKPVPGIGSTPAAAAGAAAAAAALVAGAGRAAAEAVAVELAPALLLPLGLAACAGRGCCADEGWGAGTAVEEAAEATGPLITMCSDWGQAGSIFCKKDKGTRT